ncbi:hypothetical protein Rsub_08666 [Raphidocelis subcapitata]|uniref:Uncharacterized protein n=1 Tax=Raphidocelis subcapitata TaxID=307507 RepID=A0A2V0P739_9CHLO|nr:hypothetical protein Rsub_08666 [Raphidocelis subcapitata]|eukprot:GBF95684.1 hypothetical protein Rsub_08666 [Raphidocelis subcapitata]
MAPPWPPPPPRCCARAAQVADGSSGDDTAAAGVPEPSAGPPPPQQQPQPQPAGSTQQRLSWRAAAPPAGAAAQDDPWGRRGDGRPAGGGGRGKGGPSGAGGRPASGSGGGGNDDDGGGGLEWYVAEDGQSIKGPGWTLASAEAKEWAHAAARIYGRGATAALLSGKPPAGYSDALGAAHDAEARERAARLAARVPPLSREYRQRLAAAAAAATAALSAAAARRPPVPEETMQELRGLEELARETRDPDAAEIAATLVKEVSDGQPLDERALELLAADEPHSEYETFGVGGQDLDEWIRANMLGQESSYQQKDHFPALKDNAAQFFGLLESDWEPIFTLYGAASDAFDKPLTLAALRALAGGAAERWELCGHRESQILACLVRELAERAQRFLPEMTPSEMAMLSATLGRFSVNSRPVLTALQREAFGAGPAAAGAEAPPPQRHRQQQDRQPQPRQQQQQQRQQRQQQRLTTAEASDLLWGMAKVGHRPPTAWLLSVAQGAISAADGGPADAVSLGRLLFSLALIRFRPGKDLLSAVYSASAPHLAAFSPRQLSNTIWATAELGARPPAAWLGAALEALASAHAAAAAEAAAPAAPPLGEWWRRGAPGGGGGGGGGVVAATLGEARALRRAAGRALAVRSLGGGPGGEAAREVAEAAARDLGPDQLADIVISLEQLLRSYSSAAAPSAAAGRGGGFKGRGKARGGGAAASEAAAVAEAVARYMPSWYEATLIELPEAEPLELCRLLAGAAAIADGAGRLRPALAALRLDQTATKGGLRRDGEGGGGGGGPDAAAAAAPPGKGRRWDEVRSGGGGGEYAPPPRPPGAWLAVAARALHVRRTAFAAGAFADLFLSLGALVRGHPEEGLLLGRGDGGGGSGGSSSSGGDGGGGERASSEDALQPAGAAAAAAAGAGPRPVEAAAARGAGARGDCISPLLRGLASITGRRLRGEEDPVALVHIASALTGLGLQLPSSWLEQHAAALSEALSAAVGGGVLPPDGAAALASEAARIYEAQAVPQAARGWEQIAARLAAAGPAPAGEGLQRGEARRGRGGGDGGG